MNEEKTKLIIEAEARGFDGAQKAVDAVVGAAEGGKGGAFNKLEAALTGINAALSKLDTIVGSLAKKTEGIAKDSKKAEQKQAETPPQHGFSRGLLQGLGVAEYIPGVTRSDMVRQAAGSMVGRSLYGAAHGVFGSAFSGIGGISTALASNPFTSAGAGMLNNAVAAVQDALELQRAQQGVAGLLNYRGADAAAGRARAGGIGAIRRALTHYEGLEEERGLLREYPSTDLGNGYQVGRGPTDTFRDDRMDVLAGRKPQRDQYAETVAMQAEIAAKAYDLTTKSPMLSSAGGAQARSAADGLASAARYQSLFGFAGTGVRFGLDQTATTEAAGEIARARGGYISRSGVGAALGARSAFGIDLGTSGSIFRGLKTGAGVEGSSDGEALAKTIGRAMALGLEGSEISDYLQATAEGISRFESSGIKLADGAAGAMARMFVGSGMENSLAARQGRGLASGVQNLMSSGLPGTPMGFAALVHMGGYGGGGIEDALGARSRLMNGDFKAGGAEEIVRLLAKEYGGGPRTQAYGVEMGLKQLGLNLGPDQAMNLNTVLQGGQLDPKLRTAVEEAMRRMVVGPGSAEELENLGEERTPGGLKRQAGIKNRRIAAGQAAMGVVQDFEDRSTRASLAAGELADKLRILNPLLDKIVGGLENAVHAATQSGSTITFSLGN